MQKYNVKASHPVMDNFSDVVIVHKDVGKFYATHAALGCGKSFATPDEAIRHLLNDHAYRIITMTPTHDVTVVNHGSLIGFTLNTDQARTWAVEHIPENAQWLGEDTFFAESRYAEHIAEGMASDGLAVG